MGFKQFINRSDANTPEEIVGLTVYYLMMYGGEDTVQSSIAHDILDLFDFPISETAIALNMKKIKEDGDLRYFERSNAPSGYILTQGGMERFENLAPAVKSTEEGFKISTDNKITQRRASDSNWDMFISHASEDKDDFVKPLANTLEERGSKIWYDDFQLSIGDSIPEEIDKGLSKSDYGVVVLSDAFFQKDWPQEELHSLIHKNVDSKRNIILPVWYDIGSEQVANNSPLLASRMAIRADSSSIDEVADQLLEEIQSVESSGVDQNKFDPRTRDYLADLISKTWTGDDLSRFFERQDIDIDWDAAKEGTIREHIATFPVEAEEKGLDLERARKTAVRDVLEEVNRNENRSLEDIITEFAHPQSYIGNQDKHSQVVSELNSALEYEGLKVNSDGELFDLE